jgi:hypothetical protein
MHKVIIQPASAGAGYGVLWCPIKQAIVSTSQCVTICVSTGLSDTARKETQRTCPCYAVAKEYNRALRTGSSNRGSLIAGSAQEARDKTKTEAILDKIGAYSKELTIKQKEAVVKLIESGGDAQWIKAKEVGHHKVVASLVQAGVFQISEDGQSVAIAGILPEGASFEEYQDEVDGKQT